MLSQSSVNYSFTLAYKAIQYVDMSVTRLISIQQNNNTCSFSYPLFASINTCTNYTSMPICYLCNSCIVNIHICYQCLNLSGAYTLIRQQNTQYTFLAMKYPSTVHSFSVHIEWNSLPAALRRIDSIRISMSSQKTHLSELLQTSISAI